MTETLIAVMGPTSSGKTALAIDVAEALDGEIVSCDSAAVFIGLDVGTAKPTVAEQAKVRHHLIDVVPPDLQWTAADFQQAADEVIGEIRSRSKTPILCGGTGLWMRALVHGIFQAPTIDDEIRAGVRSELNEHGSEAMHEALESVDPDAAARIEPTDPQRIGRALEVFRQTGTPISVLQAAHGFNEERYRLIGFAPAWDRDVLRERIAVRTRWMYENGLVEETARCLASGVPEDAPGLRIIGYRDAVDVVRERIDVSTAIDRTTVTTRQYAKRQRNWFNKETAVEWVPAPVDSKGLMTRLYARLNRGVRIAEP